MAGVAGLEPAHDGIKTRCLTTWRHPNKEMAGVAGLEPAHDGIKTRCLTTWRHPSKNYMFRFLLREKRW